MPAGSIARRGLRAAPAALAALAVTAPAAAQIRTLPEVVITAPREINSQLLDSAGAASEGVVTRERLDQRQTWRPGELLEVTPGLIVTQHSGEGKANQYFLRGFNLDHGTDLAISVDGMPVNMRTHGHGQGYADTNFLIPELIRTVGYRKGPYSAFDGDFASAGAIHLDYLDKLPAAFAEATAGSFGHQRAVTASSAPLANGVLLLGGELLHNDGPWQRPDDYQRGNGVARWSTGQSDDGAALTGMIYGGRWHATDQVARRAVDQGSIDRFGSLDTSDGGRADRYSLSGRLARKDDAGVTRMNAYVIRSDLELFSNFTYFLHDPVSGDQFKQLDARTLAGFNLSRGIEWKLGRFEAETTFGAETRYDDIHVGLFDTVRRQVVSTVREDHVGEASAGFYGQQLLRWTDWFRTIGGLRTDVFHVHVRSDNALNGGKASDAMASPKLTLVFGPWLNSELYLNYGMGYHSNDARGATIRVDPNDNVTPLSQVPLLVRSRGEEIGIRTEIPNKLQATASLFLLDLDSELVFAGDAGTTEPSRPGRRIGTELTLLYQAFPWLLVDLDAAFSRARFRDAEPVGDRIPGAVEGVFSGALYLDNLGPWFGSLQLRYFGPRPLLEDNSVRSASTTLLSARIGYKLTDNLRLRLEGFNLLNHRSSQIDYFYASRLPGEPPAGVNDIHFHPVEPLGVRVALSARF